MNQTTSKDDAGIPTLKSQVLFQGGREVVIEHDEERYRLLITKSGKLILNK